VWMKGGRASLITHAEARQEFLRVFLARCALALRCENPSLDEYVKAMESAFASRAQKTQPCMINEVNG
jgi:hypothetical protein